MNTKDIIFIEINDWDCEFETEKCKHIFDNEMYNKLPFNYSLTTVDMANFFLITTTEKDLKENGYEELLEYKVDFDNDITCNFSKNFYRKYNPKNWYSKDNNGKYFSSDKYFKTMWLFVDEYNNEMLYTTSFIVKPIKTQKHLELIRRSDKYSDEYCDIVEKYLKEHYVYEGKGWYTTLENVQIDNKTYKIPKLDKYVVLPTGFIETQTGKKMTHEDEPYNYTPFNVEDLQIWNE